jgi:5-methylcytosine-specific restriction protein A
VAVAAVTRAVPEWIGKTDDTPAPPRVRLRVWDRCEGKCHRCARKIPTGDAWILEHLIALINGGENRERNLCLTCSWCKPIKDAEDVAVKAETYRVRSKHILPSEQKRSSFGTNRNSKFKKRMDGTVVLRSTGEPV